MRTFAALLFFTCLLNGDTRYTEFRYGSFEVFSTVGDDQARKVLNELEQLRHVTGVLLGKVDPEPLWPIRLILVKSAAGTPELKLGRETYVATISAVTPPLRSQIVRLLIEANARRMPDSLETALVDLLSTLDVERTRVTLGAVPERKTKEWARLHYLSVDPQYSGKLRVLLSNLQQGVDHPTAYRNAFERTPEQIEKEVEAYWTAGNFGTIAISGKPLDAKRQFYERAVTPEKAAVVEGDALLAAGNKAGAAERYRKAGDSAEAKDGLALAVGNAGSLAGASGARALVAKAEAQSTPAAERRVALLAAAENNKRWATPHVLLAGLETEPLRKIPHLKKAADLDFRSAKAWETLAVAQEAAQQFADAGKSWAAAERASQDPAEDARIRAARSRGVELRVQQEIEAKAEAKRREQEELDRLRNAALAEIRRAEAKANQGQGALDRSKLEWYQEDKPPARVSGTLTRVDCLGKGAKLHLKTPGDADLALMVVDPGKVAIAGGGEKAFGCGAQKPARTVVVLHNEKANAKSGTAGEVLSIEFK
jgi:hypothetical protein